MRTELTQRLEQWYRARDLKSRIPYDPITFPRRYRHSEDIEIAGLIAATLAYGRVKSFWPAIDRLLALMEGSPADYLRRFDPGRERPRLRSLYYRFSTSDDLLALCLILHTLFLRHGSLRQLFESLHRPEEPDIGPLLARYVETALAVDTRPVYRHGRTPAGLAHLFSGPAQGGASKRLCLYLRWMVRPDDGIDLGLWPAIASSKLIVPLDAHVVRISRYLGLTRRKSPGWLMAQEITANLRRICPEDPVKYDFALCHYGMSGECPINPRREHCARCQLQSVCTLGSRRFPVKSRHCE